MKDNIGTLNKELGKELAKALLYDVEMPWTLAIQGYVGRFFFRAQKPPATHQCT